MTDHIVDIHIVAKAFADAGFCNDTNKIREFDTEEQLKDNIVYIKSIIGILNDDLVVTFLDQTVHGVKARIISLVAGGQKKSIDPPESAIHAAFLQQYHDKIFDTRDILVAKALDRAAYEALKRMVKDIYGEKHKETVKKYLVMRFLFVYSQ